MNTHKLPSKEVLVKIEDCSFNLVDPWSMGVSLVRYILRDKKTPF